MLQVMRRVLVAYVLSHAPPLPSLHLPSRIGAARDSIGGGPLHLLVVVNAATGGDEACLLRAIDVAQAAAERSAITIVLLLVAAAAAETAAPESLLAHYGVREWWTLPPVDPTVSVLRDGLAHNLEATLVDMRDTHSDLTDRLWTLLWREIDLSPLG